MWVGGAMTSDLLGTKEDGTSSLQTKQVRKAWILRNSNSQKSKEVLLTLSKILFLTKCLGFEINSFFKKEVLFIYLRDRE